MLFRSPKLIGALVPRFQALATELIDGFAARDRCEFVSEFAEPYAARVIAIMLGLPEEEWPVIARESVTIGLAMGVTLKEDLPQIEAALERLYAYSDELIADRRAVRRWPVLFLVRSIGMPPGAVNSPGSGLWPGAPLARPAGAF